jgi:hypothetical protein
LHQARNPLSSVLRRLPLHKAVRSPGSLLRRWPRNSSEDENMDDIDPTDAQGTPTVMPSNNVFDDLTSSLANTFSGTVQVIAQEVGTRAATSGVIAGSTANPPPGGAGKNAAANTVPGGLATIGNQLTTALGITGAPGTAAAAWGSLIPLVVAGYLIWKLFIK